MVTIEDSTLDLAEKPQAKKEAVAPKKVTIAHTASVHATPGHSVAQTHVAPTHAVHAVAATHVATPTHAAAPPNHKPPAHTAIHIEHKQSAKEHSTASHSVKQ